MSRFARARRSGSRRRSSGRRRWLLRGLAALVVLAVAGVLIAAWWLRRPWPQVSGEVAVAGLAAPVTVVRDEWGVPHLYAETAGDLFFAQGWVHAQDRLWQMEFTRRVGRGRLAEVLGEPVLFFDRATRNLGLLRSAEREWGEITGEARQALEAYAAGVNAYLEHRRGRLGVELALLGVTPEPWQPVDVLVSVKVLYWMLAENASFELTRARFLETVDETVLAEILPPYRDGLPVIVPSEIAAEPHLSAFDPAVWRDLAPILGVPGPGQGSNNWVLAGGRTASGRPILANDTHLELFMPSVWYANGLHGGGYDVVGYSLAGAPAVILGHNGRIAWGISDLVPDVEDVYFERLDDRENPRRYELRGLWRDLAVREERIEVKGAEPVVMTVYETHHGPLLQGLDERLEDAPAAALRWTGDDGHTLFQSALDLDRADDWESFRAALSLWDGPHMSFVYADTAGTIGFQATGLIPRRAPGHSGATPAVGWTGEHEWQGFIPYDELPWALNPPQGFLVTANQRVVGPEYPYPLGYEFADPFRAQRITQMLSTAAAPATLEDSARMQGDTHHLPAEALVPHLLAVEPADELEAAALEEVRGWNLRLDPEETGATVYQVWYRTLVRRLLEDELGEERAREYLEYYWVHGPVMVDLMSAGTSALFDDRRTPETETREDLAAAALTEAAGWLAERLGRDPATWRWGRLHTLTLRHRPIGMAEIPLVSDLFNGGTFPSPAGDRFTVNAAWFTLFDPDAPYAADAGAAQRILIDVGDWDRSLAVNSTGQSEHLFHPNRVDQVPLWRAGEYHPLLFSKQAVEAAGRHTLVLNPRPER